MAEQQFPHLLVRGFARHTEFRSPSATPRRQVTQRDRVLHGHNLLNQIKSVHQTLTSIKARRADVGIDSHEGVAVALEIRPKGALDFKSIEFKRDGFEVLTVQDANDAETVVIYVPDGKLVALEQRVQSYLVKNGKSGKPQNMALINAIDSVRSAVFVDLWTDAQPPPTSNALCWFQVWLRSNRQSAKDVVYEFIELAAKLKIEVEPGYVSFPGRVVVAAMASTQAMTSAAELIEMIAEVRGFSSTAEFFLSELKPYEQQEWMQDLLNRTTVHPGAQDTRLTLMDTGVNAGHPLLKAAIHVNDMHAYDPSWPIDDRHGHGTEMAGICLYGNLVPVLTGTDLIPLSHQLESVKIMPDSGHNAPHLYGTIVAQATSRVEASAPRVNRTFSMMATATGDTRGEPSEWSAMIDQLAFGRAAVDVGVTPSVEQDEQTPRLYVLAAGNIAWPDWHEYPSVNAVSSVEDPGQAWNALTVGAATELVGLDPNKYADLTLIAPHGALSPASRTSVLWQTKWPYKPDVVAEGGNASHDIANNVTVGPESVRQLTTSRDLTSPLCETGDTSAATAEVSRLCAHLASQYPNYWPETIRALVVHGARHSAHMRSTLRLQPTQREKTVFLRTFGYGLINTNLSCLSERHRPTLVIQDELQPFRKDSTVRLGNMVFHDLPWPDRELADLGENEISLRVTLSYFIEPNPSRRGWQSKFRYQSHGLRFALKGATETESEFLARVNILERQTSGDESYIDPDRDGWSYGYQLRTRGSLHSDLWTGTAIDLASKGKIVVFPVAGWWKDWDDARQWNRKVRYSLVLSLEAASDIDVDLYSPIKAQTDLVQAIDLPSGQ